MTRRPRLPQPRNRAMLVEVPVSSMKTSFAGSSEPCPAFQAVRARFGDIRPFLLGGVRGFLMLMPSAAKNHHTVP